MVKWKVNENIQKSNYYAHTFVLRKIALKKKTIRICVAMQIHMSDLKKKRA